MWTVDEREQTRISTGMSTFHSSSMNKQFCLFFFNNCKTMKKYFHWIWRMVWKLVNTTGRISLPRNKIGHVKNLNRSGVSEKILWILAVLNNIFLCCVILRKSVAFTSRVSQAFIILYGSQVTLLTQLIKPNYLVILSYPLSLPPPSPLPPPTQFNYYVGLLFVQFLTPISNHCLKINCSNFFFSPVISITITSKHCRECL